jgi:hypothetical protein
MCPMTPIVAPRMALLAHESAFIAFSSSSTLPLSPALMRRTILTISSCDKRERSKVAVLMFFRFFTPK